MPAKKWLRTCPFYVWLLPVFFVSHTLWQYAGLVTYGTGATILLQAELVTTIVYLVLRFLFSSAQQAAIVVTAANVVQFFFGDVKTALSAVPALHFVSHYTVLLPLIFVLFLVVVTVAKRKQYFHRFNTYANVLLLLFLVVDVARIAWNKQVVQLSAHRLLVEPPVAMHQLTAGNQQPDVYLLVFDSYPGRGARQKWLHDQSAAAEEGLARRGFYVIESSSSNYNKTAFSMASTLNMQYLRNTPKNQVPAPIQYNESSLMIRESQVVEVFRHFQYQLINLSCFDIAQSPALRKEDFLVLPPEKMFVYSTLSACLNRDIGWNFGSLPLLGKRTSAVSDKAETFQQNLWKKEYNDRVLDSLYRLPAQPSVEPRFVYAHLYLPHPPFFYDSTGRYLGPDIDVSSQMEDPAMLRQYIAYANKNILGIADTIISHTRRPLAIIVMSDHGYRDLRPSDMPPSAYFKNLSAVYFSDKQYQQLYKPMSNVNLFRVLFNTYFNAALPLLRDSTIEMPY